MNLNIAHIDKDNQMEMEKKCWIKRIAQLQHLDYENPHSHQVIFTTTTNMKSLKVHLATSSRGKERLHRPQLSKSLVGWLDPVDNHIWDNADVKELS